MDQPLLRTGDDRKRLPPGTLLADDIVIESELGAGGFGITYKARDKRLGRLLAVKEYFPVEIGSRDSTMSVQPLTENQGQVFQWGLEKFIDEARMLAAFNHPAIVRVLRYFEAHATAYMVLEYVEGLSFGKWLDSLRRPPTQAELDRIMTDIAGALSTIHAEKLVHRDIAPDNIIIRPDGHGVLLDFGAARYELAERSTAYSRTVHSSSYAIVKQHYSPFEQRSTDKRNRGAWSDVYALGATLYRAVTGTAPMDAMDRIASGDDTMTPAARAAKGQFRPTFLAAIDRALRIRHAERPQSISAFLDEASGRTTPSGSPPAKPAGSDDPTHLKVSSLTEFDRWGQCGGPRRPEAQSGPAPDSRPQPPKRSRGPVVATVLALIALLAGGFILAANRVNLAGSGGATPTPPKTPTQPPPVTEWDRGQQAALEAVVKLRAAINIGTGSNRNGHWHLMLRMSELAVDDARDARSAVERLQRLAQTEPQRQTVRGYSAEIDSLASKGIDLRAEAQRGIAREEEDRLRATTDARRRQDEDARQKRAEDDRRREQLLLLEDERRRREATPPPPIVERTWTVHSRRWVQGDGYNNPPPVVRDFNACARMCVDDARCRMFEHASDDKTKQPICNLYDHTKLAPGAGNATVGVMR